MACCSWATGRFRTVLWAVPVVLLLGVGGAAVLRLLRPPPEVHREPDWVAVMRANNRGVGHVEQFKDGYAAAVHDFEEVTQLAPDWVPGKINLGIALMNLALGLEGEERDQANGRALELFGDVLKKEPDSPYAHFCRGLIIYWRGKPEEYAQARQEFAAVTRVDDKDASAWYWLGRTWEDDDPVQAVTCFERALDLDPYLNGARFGLNSALKRVGQMDRAKAVLDEWQERNASGWNTPDEADKFYTDRGRYALAIGTPEGFPTPPTGPLPLFRKDDKFGVQLAPGARWATAADFGTGAVAELRAAVRKRFGATLVVFDYNRDGKPDLFLLGAVVEGGQVRDLLLRNDGSGHFTDVTAEAGLGGARPSLGCCVADIDNDTYPDLLITGAGQQHLFHNNRKGGFEDVTAKAGLDKLRSVCLGAAFVDLDQDGDLDLIVCQYAGTAEHALAALKGKGASAGPGLAVYLNVGEATVVNKGEDPPPLTVAFRRADGPPALVGGAAATVNVACTDLDLDQDLDLFALADGKPPALVLNDRLLHFHRAELPAFRRSGMPDEDLSGRWNGALVLDTYRRQRSDLLLVGPGRSPVLLVHQPNRDQPDVSKWFELQGIESPPLLQAQAIDLDFDGWTDVVGLSEQGKPVLLHNDGRHLATVPEALGSDRDWPKDLVAVVVTDTEGNGVPDLLVWSEREGLQLHTDQGNGNHGLKLDITGHRRVDPAGLPDRCNADGFGTRVLAQAGELWTGMEYTTLSAGLGQSHQPIFLGVGRSHQADVVRLFWPDLTWQAELEAPCEVRHIDQLNRKATSCPVLFAWDGHRFGFVTDFLGAGSVGECEPGGGHRPPRPEESVKIEAQQLVPRDGQLVLKIAEPMDEVTYLDRLQLVVLDHPADVRVYPDERFPGDGPPPTQDLLAFRREIFPVRARDHRGHDVTETLRRWDRDTVSDFGRRSWIGFAEDHWVELDFGDRLARFGRHDRQVLCLAGWTDYPYPESIWAAHQAGVELQPPMLERRDPDGRWRKVCEASFPAGLPRMMTLDVTGKLTGPSCVVRLRTNMQVFWDEVFVAPLLEAVVPGKGGTVRATPLEVDRASLSARGCMQEFSPDGRQPTLYDYDRLDAVPVSRLAGRLTRFGEVSELLRQTDDRFVLFGPGDELDVRFDARRLPELPAGWKRSYVLRTWGYCKDCAPFTASGATVGPLPFRGMNDYPYGAGEKYPQPDYDRLWNTRAVGGRPQ